MTTEQLLTKDTLGPLVAQARTRRDLDTEFNALFERYRQGKTDKRFHEVLQERGRLTKPLEDALQSAWALSVSSASRAGLLFAAAPETGSTIFHNVWIELLDKGWDGIPDYRHDDICEALREQLIAAFVFAEDAPADSDAAAEQILAHIEAGSLPERLGVGELFVNHADGKRVHVTMTAWAPELFMLDDEKVRTPISPMPFGLVFHNTVNFPSGRLLVSDAISVGPLEEILDQLRRAMGINVNYAEHRVRRTAVCAKLGVVEVQGSDHGPNILRAEGNPWLVAGRDEGAFETVASICHDYWGTTVIDRELLIELAFGVTDESCTREDIDAEISAWLDGSEFAHEITVAPGLWHLYWDEDRETLAKSLKDAGHATPSEVNFLLTPAPVDLPADKLRSYHKPDDVAA